MIAGRLLFAMLLVVGAAVAFGPFVTGVVFAVLVLALLIEIAANVGSD